MMMIIWSCMMEIIWSYDGASPSCFFCCCWNQGMCGWVMVGQVCRMPRKKHPNVCQTNSCLPTHLFAPAAWRKSTCAVLKEIRPSKPIFALPQPRNKTMMQSKVQHILPGWALGQCRTPEGTYPCKSHPVWKISWTILHILTCTSYHTLQFQSIKHF